MFRELASERWFLYVSSKPLEKLIGFCIFVTAAAGCAVGHAASTVLGMLFITSLVHMREWPALWTALNMSEKTLLIGLVLYAFSGLISYYNVGDESEYIKHMGRYIRFLLILPVYLLFTKANLDLFKYLVAGAITSGPLYLFFALLSVYERPGLPASGGYHHIAFGDAAMLSVVFLSAVLVTWKTRRTIKVIMVISILCALYASILSQARGAWMAIPFCGAWLLYLTARHNTQKIKTVLSLLLLVIVATGVSPLGKVIEKRVDEAVQEVGFFIKGENLGSSVGTRLAMWQIALNVWQKHPVIGTGLGDFDQEIEIRQSQGSYEDVAVHSNVHNIYFQALATTGTLGFLILFFSLLLQPFLICYRASVGKLTPASLGGMTVMIAYAAFGLTASWILRAPEVSVYLVYLITVVSTVSRVSNTTDSKQ